MGHTAMASAASCRVPANRAVSFTVVSEDTRPELSPSCSPCKALPYYYLNTLNGDDIAFLSVVTCCSRRVGVDGGWVTWSAHHFLQPQRTHNWLLLAHLHFSPHYSIKKKKSSSGFCPSCTPEEERASSLNSFISFIYFLMYKFLYLLK